jgi:hypothetical protein
MRRLAIALVSAIYVLVYIGLYSNYNNPASIEKTSEKL